MKKYQGARILKNWQPNPMLADYYAEMERLKHLPPKVLRMALKEIKGE